MSFEYTANICYGLKTTDDKLINKIDENELELDRDLAVAYGGSEFTNDGITAFICIKKTLVRVNLYSDYKHPIKSENLISNSAWHSRLVEWAKENDCSDYKIGWWLFVTES